ncbi:hypothetical protein B0H10DRAFT_1852652, partial [Mycena sp. CBHHK59/15]
EKQHKDAHKIACYQCQLPIKPDESRSHVGVHILRAMRNLPESKLVEKVREFSLRDAVLFNCLHTGPATGSLRFLWPCRLQG